MLSLYLALFVYNNGKVVKTISLEHEEEDLLIPSVWISLKAKVVFWPLASQNDKLALQNLKMSSEKTWRYSVLV